MMLVRDEHVCPIVCCFWSISICINISICKIIWLKVLKSVLNEHVFQLTQWLGNLWSESKYQNLKKYATLPSTFSNNMNATQSLYRSITSSISENLNLQHTSNVNLEENVNSSSIFLSESNNIHGVCIAVMLFKEIEGNVAHFFRFW